MCQSRPCTPRMPHRTHQALPQKVRFCSAERLADHSRSLTLYILVPVDERSSAKSPSTSVSTRTTDVIESNNSRSRPLRRTGTKIHVTNHGKGSKSFAMPASRLAVYQRAPLSPDLHRKRQRNQDGWKTCKCAWYPLKILFMFFSPTFSKYSGASAEISSVR